jgi:hypothetical protein
MANFCDYHPKEKAYWDCPKCEVFLCNRCVSKRTVEQYGKKKDFYYCPKCNEQVERAFFEDTVVPFWLRLPKFFLYPFHLWPLVLAFILAVADVLISKHSLIGMLLNFAMWGVLLKYSHAALKNTANGRINTPPPLNFQTISSEFEIVFKQVFIFVTMGFVSYKIFGMFGPIIGLLFVAFALLSIPSMIIVLVATNSFLCAINPILFVTMAWRIGWGYLLMYLFLLLIGGAPGALGAYVLSYLHRGIQPFLFSLAGSFYTIVSYHLMGYVIYQYHEEIGYSVDIVEDDSDMKPEDLSEDPEKDILKRVSMLIKDGKHEEAIDLIKEETKGHITNQDLADRYFMLLKIKKMTPDLIEHGKNYLDILSRSENRAKLCEVYLELIQYSDFRMTSPVLLKVAGALNEAGNHKAAVDAYNRFVKANPSSPLAPKAYFLGAKIINEKLGNPAKAIGILQGLVKKFPRHDIIPYVKQYLGGLKAGVRASDSV